MSPEDRIESWIRRGYLSVNGTGKRLDDVLDKVSTSEDELIAWATEEAENMAVVKRVGGSKNLRAIFDHLVAERFGQLVYALHGYYVDDCAEGSKWLHAHRLGIKHEPKKEAAPRRSLAERYLAILPEEKRRAAEEEMRRHRK